MYGDDRRFGLLARRFAVRRALICVGEFKGVEGVKSFTVSLMTERAVCEHDTSILSAEEVVDM